MKLNKLTTQELLNLLDEHDCHISQDDSCDCYLVLRELEARINKESQIL